MKRLLLIIASSVLLLAGCTKENVTLSNNDGELQRVTFTAALENGVTTKAVADGDGAAADVNRCIMEVYYDGTLFGRQVKPVTDKKASFTMQMVSNRTYTVAFWADKATVNGSVAEGFTDLYYNASSLDSISIKSGYIGNDDARDAFFASDDNFTVPQGGKSFNVTLKRPFAQMNVITTDWNVVSKVGTLKPEKVNVTLKNPMVKFNAVTGVASADSNIPTLNYEAALYTSPNPVQPVSDTVKTLSMDYLFASETKEMIDIDWKATKANNADVAHSFAAVPYQRNYRTNIKGALLTTTGQWNVTVDPIWDKLTGDKDIEVFYEQVGTGSDVKGALDGKNGDSSQDGKGAHISIDQGKGTADVNDDIIIPDNTPKDKTPEITLDFQTLVAGSQIIIRDENHERTAAEASSGAKEYDGEIIVIVPEGTTANQVKILTSKSTVTVRGQYGTVIASCAPQTIIVEAGTVIGKLEVMKGNVEVYGEVTSIENKTAAQEADKSVVYVYLCQGSVWTNVAVEKNDKLVPLYPVAKIGETFYFSIPEAIAAVNDGEIVSMISDVTLSEKLLISNGKEFTFDLGGKTLTGRVNVSGAKLTVKNGTIDAGSFAQALNAYGTRDLAYVGNLFTYIKVESDVTLKGAYGMCFLSNIADGYYPEAYGVKVDFYGKSDCVSPSYVSGNIGYDNYVANLGSGYTPNLPAGISAPSKAMKLYGPEFNVYGTLGSNGASLDESPQGISLSGMIRVNVYEGASITGDEAIGMKSGLVNVYGGTLTSVGAKIDPVQAVSSGTEASGAAISITSFYTFDMFADRATMEVNISGGTIQSTNNSALLVTHSYSGGQPVALKQGVDLSITGGSFIGGTGVPVVFIDNAATGDAFAMPSKFISGGVYSSKPDTKYIDPAYDAVQEGDVWVIKSTGYSIKATSVESTGFVEKVPVYYKYYIGQYNNLQYNLNSISNNTASILIGNESGKSGFSAKYPCFVEVTLLSDYAEDIKLSGHKLIIPAGVEYTGTVSTADSYTLEEYTTADGAKVYNSVQASFDDRHCTFIEALRLLQNAQSGQIAMLKDKVAYPTASAWTPISTLRPGMSIKMNGYTFANNQIPLAQEGYMAVLENDVYTIQTAVAKVAHWNTGASVLYATLAAAVEGVNGDYRVISLVGNTDESITLPMNTNPDVIFNTNGKTYTGTVSAPSGYIVAQNGNYYFRPVAKLTVGTAETYYSGDLYASYGVGSSQKSGSAIHTIQNTNGDCTLDFMADYTNDMWVYAPASGTLTLKTNGYNVSNMHNTTTSTMTDLVGNGTYTFVKK